MCRMLLASGNVDMGFLLDGLISMALDQNEIHERNEEGGLGSWQHAGGWGIAYLKDGKWITHKSTKPVFEDSSTELFRNIKTNLVVMHARFATVGTVCLENTHPFLIKDNKEFGDVVFCHNGTIRGDIPYNQEKYTPQGVTDSERLFFSLLTDFSINPDFPDAIKKNMAKHQNTAGVNVILSSPKISFISIKENDAPLYYCMKISRKDGMTVISSEKIPRLEPSAYLDQGEIAILKGNELEIIPRQDL